MHFVLDLSWYMYIMRMDSWLWLMLKAFHTNITYIEVNLLEKYDMENAHITASWNRFKIGFKTIEATNVFCPLALRFGHIKLISRLQDRSQELCNHFCKDSCAFISHKEWKRNCSHGLRMGREENLLFWIVIADTNELSSIFPNSTNYFVPSYLKHLELDKFGLSQFLKYRSSNHPSLSASQRLFAQRMQDVLLNRLDSSSKYDMYLHDLVDCLIQECYLNDGLNVYTRRLKASILSFW